MTTASSVARSAVVVRAVADDAMPSSLTASVAASLRAVGILIEVLDVSSSPSSRSSLIRSITTCSSMQITYHTPVVQTDLPRLRSRFQLGGNVRLAQIEDQSRQRRGSLRFRLSGLITVVGAGTG
jgi:hypothetical protein